MSALPSLVPSASRPVRRGALSRLVLSRPVLSRLVLSRLVAPVLLLVASVGVLAAPAAADVRPVRLTTAQEREVLRLIDNACGDTWCEGDHAFRFARFSCHPKRATCLLVVQIASWSEEPLRWQWRAQPVHGFARFADMVATAPDGRSSLQPAFFTTVGQAVSAMEATVAPAMPTAPTGCGATLRSH